MQKIIVLLCFVISLSVINVSAYKLWRHKWEKKTVYWYYDNDYNKLKTACSDSADAWNKYSSVKLKKGEKIGHSVTVDEVNNSSVEWDGITSVYAPNNVATKAVILINRAKPAWDNTYRLKSVVANEMGHVLGLADTNGKALMNGYTSMRYDTYGIYEAVTDDKNGIWEIYN